MKSTEVVVYRNAETLASATAASLLAKAADLLSTAPRVSLLLTGGRTGIAVLAQLPHQAGSDRIDWSRIDLFWGDERFLPAGHPERNETQARAAFIDHVPVPEEHVHPIEPSDGRFGDDPNAAAAAYAGLLVPPAPALTAPAICLLGVGPEGHIASVFPESPAVHETERLVVAIRHAPKPPPTRISLTLPAIRRCTEVWLMTSGADRAEVVGSALTGAEPSRVPAAGAHGLRRTLWSLDVDAAARVPPHAHMRRG